MCVSVLTNRGHTSFEYVISTCRKCQLRWKLDLHQASPAVYFLSTFFYFQCPGSPGFPWSSPDDHFLLQEFPTASPSLVRIGSGSARLLRMIWCSL